MATIYVSRIREKRGDQMTQTPQKPAAGGLLPGEEILTAAEIRNIGIDIAPPGFRSDDELRIAARKGQEDYHG